MNYHGQYKFSVSSDRGPRSIPPVFHVLFSSERRDRDLTVVTVVGEYKLAAL